MDIKERKKFYEKVYFYELDRRDQIYGKLRLPITVLTFTTSVNFFLVTKLLVSYIDPYNATNFILGAAVILLSISILTYLLHCIYRVLVGWEYNEVSLKDFEEYYDKLAEHYKKYNRENLNEQELKLMTEETFEKTLTQQLVECTDHNHKINIAKGNYILNFIEALPAYLFFLALLYAASFNLIN